MTVYYADAVFWLKVGLQYTAGTKLSIYLVLPAAFANLLPLQICISEINLG